jgi:hypothetical protein
MDERDVLGRVVRSAWIRWAETQSNPKPSWLVPYDELSEPDKEADRQIAEAVRDHFAVPELIEALESIEIWLSMVSVMLGGAHGSARHRDIARAALAKAKRITVGLSYGQTGGE